MGGSLGDRITGVEPSPVTIRSPLRNPMRPRASCQVMSLSENQFCQTTESAAVADEAALEAFTVADARSSSRRITSVAPRGGLVVAGQPQTTRANNKPELKNRNALS